MLTLHERASYLFHPISLPYLRYRPMVPVVNKLANVSWQATGKTDAKVTLALLTLATGS